MDFEEAASRLYAAPASDFIAVRNDLAKQLKASGDEVGSARLKALRKPTVAAWITNLLAREVPDDVDDLLALGDELREATADLDGERLRELTPQRQKHLDKLTKTARKLAEDAGQKVSQDVALKIRETLDAALIDPSAGEAVREGRLGSALRHVGFGVVDEAGDPSVITPLTDERRRRAEERRRARRGAETAPETEKLDKAEKEVAEREAARAEAQRELDEAEDAADAAQKTTDRLAKELKAARERLEKAQDEVFRLSDEVDEAKKQARATKQAAQEARRRLNRLRG